LFLILFELLNIIYLAISTCIDNDWEIHGDFCYKVLRDQTNAENVYYLRLELVEKIICACISHETHSSRAIKIVNVAYFVTNTCHIYNSNRGSSWS